MTPSLTDRADLLLERLRVQFGQRGPGVLLALALEALLILAVLTLGSPMLPGSPEAETLTSVNIEAVSEPDEAPPEPAKTPEAAEPPQETRKPEPQPVPEERVEEVVPVPIPVRPVEVQKPAPPAPPPPAPPAVESGPMMGPPVPRSRTPDSRRVEGSGPNGEPLYAAAWYREPKDGELRGYLSTATGPGWGMIACKTAPDYRVEDCIPIAEYPAHSNINRSILAAAWQFQVRPPRIGGRPMIGEWVRIRIDYGM